MLLLFGCCFGACIPARTQLLRELHDGLDEVRTSESSEMPYRAPTPDLDPLIGMKRNDIGDELGAGDCDPQAAGAQRCLYRFSTDADAQSTRPLVLELDFDRSERCTGARWRELR